MNFEQDTIQPVTLLHSPMLALLRRRVLCLLGLLRRNDLPVELLGATFRPQGETENDAEKSLEMERKPLSLIHLHSALPLAFSFPVTYANNFPFFDLLM